MAHTLLDRSACAEVTEATRVATRNLAANRAALAGSQPRLAEVLPPAPEDLTWIFGRDGYLTAMAPGEAWLTGCSVPLLAGRAVLKTLDPGSGSVCFLNPQHAAHVRVAFEHLQPNQALLCLIADGTDLATLLHCDDFSAEIASGRLWLAWGDDWASRLADVLKDKPGVPVPSRFIRLLKVDQPVLEQTIAAAQAVFNETTAARAAAIAASRAGWARRDIGSDGPRVCVVARSMFRLWDDAGEALFRTVQSSGDAQWTRFDPDDPAGCSPVALAAAIANADAVVAADVARADLPAGLAPLELPWIAWITAGRIPAFASAGPNDRLLLADSNWMPEATHAGWPAERLSVAGWPVGETTSAPSAPALAIIADTCAIEPPEAVTEFSSQTLLWEKIRQSIARDPLALPEDPAAWVSALATAHGIDLRTLDVPLFVNRLVLPAYAQAVADMLIAAGVPVRLHGSGWQSIPRFAGHAIGPVTSREELSTIASSSAGIIHAWPAGAAHPVDAFGRFVLRRSGNSRDAYLRQARQAVAGPVRTPPASRTAQPTLSAATILAQCPGRV